MKKVTNMTPEELEKLRETIAAAQALAVKLLRQRLHYAGAMREGRPVPFVPEGGCMWGEN